MLVNAICNLRIDIDGCTCVEDICNTKLLSLALKSNSTGDVIMVQTDSWIT